MKALHGTQTVRIHTPFDHEPGRAVARVFTGLGAASSTGHPTGSQHVGIAPLDVERTTGV